MTAWESRTPPDFFWWGLFLAVAGSSPHLYFRTFSRPTAEAAPGPLAGLGRARGAESPEQSPLGALGACPFEARSLNLERRAANLRTSGPDLGGQNPEVRGPEVWRA
ncbi:hypothetical protein FMEAI12_5460002 [Parafrankia sp. Ea1.12]|nr:hypothetical protein FMEAI12_5460002 [Parafrankia sp. Ea1.12]